VANLRDAVLSEADLGRANLNGADLRGADLRAANLWEAHLIQADLSGAVLVDADLRGADLTGCRIFGVSAWSLKLDTRTKQQNLVITREQNWFITNENEPEITVDNIEVAQFIYLLLHNEKLQRVIDTITTKVVLILGRFSLSERKEVLDALRSELRKPGRDYVRDFRGPVPPFIECAKARDEFVPVPLGSPKRGRLLEHGDADRHDRRKAERIPLIGQRARTHAATSPPRRPQAPGAPAGTPATPRPCALSWP
jgi:hypothetical protein